MYRRTNRDLACIGSRLALEARICNWSSLVREFTDGIVDVKWRKHRYRAVNFY